MHSAEEGICVLTELRKIGRWLDVCDGNMEEGHALACEYFHTGYGNTALGKVEIKP